jgi:hypothetical protein
MTEISIPQTEKLLIEIKNKFWKKNLSFQNDFSTVYSVTTNVKRAEKLFFVEKKSFLIAMPNLGGAKIRSVFILITF